MGGGRGRNVVVRNSRWRLPSQLGNATRKEHWLGVWRLHERGSLYTNIGAWTIQMRPATHWRLRKPRLRGLHVVLADRFQGAFSYILLQWTLDMWDSDIRDNQMRTLFLVLINKINANFFGCKRISDIKNKIAFPLSVFYIQCLLMNNRKRDLIWKYRSS